MSKFDGLDDEAADYYRKLLGGSAAGSYVVHPAAEQRVDAMKKASEKVKIHKPIVRANTGFDDTKTIELSMGSVVGARTWEVDKLGRLTGVSYKDVYKPGVNEAICDYCGLERTLDKCSHGFYAYYDGKNAHGYLPVHGVVRGTGETIIGTEGFRSMKLEILALYVRGATRAALSSRAKSENPSKFLEFLGRRVFPRPITRARADDPNIFNMSMIFALITVASLFVVLGAGVYPVLVLPVLAWTYMISNLLTYYKPWRNRERSRRDSAQTGEANQIALRLRELYPDIPLYVDEKKMLRDFKLSKPEDFETPPPPLPSPDTDPDFWSRSD